MSPLIESVFFIPIFLVLFGGSLYFSALSVSTRLLQWGCYQIARHTLVNAPFHIIEKDKHIFRLAPWGDPPHLTITQTDQTARVTVHQTLHLFGKSHAIQETFTLHQ